MDEQTEATCFVFHQPSPPPPTTTTIPPPIITKRYPKIHDRPQYVLLLPPQANCPRYVANHLRGSTGYDREQQQMGGNSRRGGGTRVSYYYDGLTETEGTSNIIALLRVRGDELLCQDITNGETGERGQGLG